MHKIALSCMAGLLAASALSAHADTIWKWRDAKGQIHLSDTGPPSDIPEKNILARPNGQPAGTALAAADAPAAPPAAASGAAIDADLQARRKKVEQDKRTRVAAAQAEVAQKNEAIRAENCGAAQQQIKTMQSGVRLARPGANGEREFLDDAARAQELKRAQGHAAANCGPASAPAS